MLAGTVTEGAHYFSDVFAGVGMAFFGYCLARHIIRAEDRLFSPPRPVSCSLGEDAAIAGLANR
jgi:membrane-associated phospholipid phosphatase